MDFRFDDAELALRDLAREILVREATPERVKAAERAGDFFDRALWARLAEANLLGVAVPAAQGGMELGFLALCLLLHEIGRATAPLPALAALVLGGLPLARFGSDAQRERWLAPLAAGDAVLTAALEDADGGERRPATRARRADGGWLLDGVKRAVPAAGVARCVLVPARSDAGIGVFLVDPRAPGVTLGAQATSRREPVFALELAGVRVGDEDLLGGDPAAGDAVLPWLREHATAAVSAMQLGVSERALELTCAHLRERVQFGAPIGSFPAVQQRAADGYVDLAAMRWTTWQAVWRLARGERAGREVAVAKYWAAEGGARIAASAQHLHGGLGSDVDYPIHRYFLWSRACELAFGGAMPQLARLGRELAGSGPRELA